MLLLNYHGSYVVCELVLMKLSATYAVNIVLGSLLCFSNGTTNGDGHVIDSKKYFRQTANNTVHTN